MAFCMAFASAGSSYVFATEHIEEVSVQTKAAPVNGGIEVSSTEQTTFEVYSITGQQVKSVTVSNESQTIELPKGCYIVRCPQWSKKVIVK